MSSGLPNSGDLRLNSRKHSKRLRDAEPRDINGGVVGRGAGGDRAGERAVGPCGHANAGGDFGLD